VLGQVTSGGATQLAGLRIFLFPGVMPLSPYAYVNANGEFLFRLPQLRTTFSGGAITNTATLNVVCLDPANTPVVIAPASVNLTFGRVRELALTVP
jgi:hypothetical protein